MNDQRSRGSAAGANPLRVLVVDDEPAILRFLRAGLSAQGFTVSEAERGGPALDSIRRGGADLVVLDLGLPDMDGLEVIRQAREAGSAPQSSASAGAEAYSCRDHSRQGSGSRRSQSRGAGLPVLPDQGTGRNSPRRLTRISVDSPSTR